MSSRILNYRFWLRPLILASSDFLAVSLAFLMCVLVRYAWNGQFELFSYIKLWPVAFLFVLTYAASGGYRVLTAPPMGLKLSTLGTCFLFLFLAAITFWSRTAENYSRIILFSACVTTCFFVPIGRRICHIFFASMDWWRVPAIVYGNGDVAASIIKNIQQDYSLGLNPVAVVEGGDLSSSYSFGISTYTYKDIPYLSSNYPCAYFILAQPDFTLAQYQKILAETGRFFFKTLIAPDIFREANMWAKVVDINGVLALETGQKLFSLSSCIQKRVMDIVFSFGGLILLIPLFLLVGLVIKINSPGPVFYCQRRLGRYGESFNLWKFRTMVANADAVLKSKLKEDELLKLEWDEKQKLRVDPRITKVGHFLRKTSLDELPQLWNVLRGDMSLVGPRPIVESEVEKYASNYVLYMKVRPGMTGLWQISGRSSLSYAERVRLDTYYIRNWSTWFDIYILSKTPCAVLKCFGAY